MPECVCEYCDFFTDKAWVMRSHKQKVHRRKIVKECVYECGFTSLHYSYLAHHMFTQHNMKQCLFCACKKRNAKTPYTFRDANGFARHLRSCPVYHSEITQASEKSQSLYNVIKNLPHYIM